MAAASRGLLIASWPIQGQGVPISSWLPAYCRRIVCVNPCRVRVRVRTSIGSHPVKEANRMSVYAAIDSGTDIVMDLNLFARSARFDLILADTVNATWRP